MSLTAEESHLLGEDLTPREKALISDTFDDLETMLRDMGYVAHGDDRMAKLEAALVRYIIAGRP